MVTQENLPKKLIAEVEEDPAFRGRFITNPGSVLKEVFGIEVPEDANVFADEDDARMAHLVLPASAALTAAQLELAAGGDFCNDQGWGAQVDSFSRPWLNCRSLARSRPHTGSNPVIVS